MHAGVSLAGLARGRFPDGNRRFVGPLAFVVHVAVFRRFPGVIGLLATLGRSFRFRVLGKDGFVFVGSEAFGFLGFARGAEIRDTLAGAGIGGGKRRRGSRGDFGWGFGDLGGFGSSGRRGGFAFTRFGARCPAGSSPSAAPARTARLRGGSAR